MQNQTVNVMQENVREPSFKQLVNILKCFADMDTLKLIQEVRETGTFTLAFGRNKLGLSRRQAYLRMAKLKQLNIVMRANHNQYKITSFGEIMLHSIDLMSRGLKQLWAINVVDDVLIHSKNRIDTQQFELITKLVQDNEIRNMLFPTH